MAAPSRRAVTVTPMTTTAGAPSTPTAFPTYHVARRAPKQHGALVSADLIRAEAIEQVMRVSSDEDLLLTLIAADPGTRAGAAAAGRAMEHPTVKLSLTEGCPILAYANASPLDIGWRRWCPPAPTSLYAELALCRALWVGQDPTDEYDDAYDELEQARLAIAA